MVRLATEQDILEATLDVLKREAGLRLKIVEREVRRGDKYVDAILGMPQTGTELIAEIKKWTAQANAGALINQIKHIAEAGKGILLADYINPKLGERLKAADIQYADAAGNAFINQPPIYIYIKGNRPALGIAELGTAKTGKAFQPAGMRIVYAFLVDQELINAPYRAIAARAQVALGVVGGVIRDLIAQGLLQEGVRKNERTLNNVDLLLDKWVEAYPHKLKEKQRLGIFTTHDINWWKAIDPKKYDALWAGEVAAAQYTDYLNPKNVVVYIPQANVAKFVNAARLRKPGANQQPDIHIDLLQPFWREADHDERAKSLVHPIVAYADLIETGEPRNLETARRLREQFIH